jgi:hypothetical protein
MKGITKTQKEYVKKEYHQVNAILEKDFRKMNDSIQKITNYAVETGYKIGYTDAKKGRKPQFEDKQ